MSHGADELRDELLYRERETLLGVVWVADGVLGGSGEAEETSWVFK